ncbi:MAG: hypothetical protein DHS20C14_12280 [Phycisphaeraceae bacterium]|nr:MAG: hypothetical protein DHS20C14_12280 [Phycisphaeraceae bacterium]
MLTLGISGAVVSVMVAIFLFACVVLILTVLIQRPQGGGLSGAFGAGGGGAGATAFGTKTGDALTIATIAMFVLFLGLAIGLNFATRPENITSGPAQIEPTGDDGIEGATILEDEGTADDAAAAIDAAIGEGTQAPAAVDAPAVDGATDEGAADEPAGETTPPAETPEDG